MRIQPLTLVELPSGATTDFRNRLVNVVLNTVLLMLVQPDAITKGQASGRSTNMGQEFWSPNIIGQGMTPSEVEDICEV